MKEAINLSEFQLEEIRKLANGERQKLGFMSKTPIANDMATILDSLDIILLEYPIKSESDRQAFSAALMYSKEGGKELVFIGVNTADYYDKQLFALAHELYHYFTKTNSHLSRLEVEEDIVEVMANRFAAEFLLPENTLKSIVLEEFKTSNLGNKQVNAIIRFVARLQCTWWLPYRSLVKRLKEVQAISKQQYEELYKINERDANSYYSKIGRAINQDVFAKLNTATSTIGTSARDIEVVIRNFEDDLIDEDEFSGILNLFKKTPDDFGYSINVEDDDLDNLNTYFNEEIVDEG